MYTFYVEIKRTNVIPGSVWVHIFQHDNPNPSAYCAVIWFDDYANQLSNLLMTYAIDHVYVDSDCVPYIHLRR